MAGLRQRVAFFACTRADLQRFRQASANICKPWDGDRVPGCRNSPWGLAEATPHKEQASNEWSGLQEMQQDSSNHVDSAAARGLSLQVPRMDWMAGGCP